MHNPRTIPTWLFLSMSLLLASPGMAATLAGVEFDEIMVVEEVGDPLSLELCSTGLLRYRKIFKGYAAALYRADCAASTGTRAIAARRLELSYFWSIDGEKFGKAAEFMLREQLQPSSFAALESRMARLHRSYRSVAPGDRYALTYLPGRGTELSLNGRSLVVIEGEDFARAYFDIWLGDRPIEEELRNALLARNATD